MGKFGERSSKTIDNESYIFYEIQDVLRKKLAAFHSWPNKLLGLQEQERHLKELFIRTIKTGENNSVILVGPRGSGKSSVLEKVKKELCDVPEFRNNCLMVNLNGLIHTDDRTALKDIIHQLQLENTFEGKIFGSFADTLTFLLETLKNGNQNSKVILFSIDEFDLFCQHKNQTLLYNLFDIAQAAKVPIAVVGITCRLDVMELLEKRVRSRFSHRILNFFIALSFQNYMDIAEDILCLPNHFSNVSVRKKWNEHIRELLQEKEVKSSFKRLYDTSRDIRALKRFLLLPVSAVNEEHPSIVASDFLDSQTVQILDSKAAMLHEFQKCVQKKASVQQFDKAVVMKAFEHLLSIELIKTESKQFTQTQNNYQLVQLLLQPTQVREALQRYPNLPTELQQWANSALT